MLKINYSILFFLGLFLNSFSYADDGGSRPGYVYTPSSGSTLVKTAYGQCLHNAYWKPAYGVEECGEAPEKPLPPPEVKHTVIETINLSDADTVLFDFNKIELTPLARQKMLQFIDKFKESADVTKITINGYTDAIGDATYNQTLSAQRAEVIKKFFIDNGFNSATIVAVGMGAESAIVSSTCLAQYGKDHLQEINNLSRRLKQLKSAKAIRELKIKINQLVSHREKLIACTRQDRRVTLVIEHTITKMVKPNLNASGSIPASGLISTATAIESNNPLDDE